MKGMRRPEIERCERHMEVRWVPGEKNAQCLHVVRREPARYAERALRHVRPDKAG